jgi:hypothetical protein
MSATELIAAVESPTVMHPNDTYTPDEAKNLIALVKGFMGQLAGII